MHPTSNQAFFSLSYEIVGADRSTYDLAYGISESTDERATFSISYGIVPTSLTSWAPTQTPWGYMTQVMGNALPYWHAGRKKVGGRTQRVVNALAGFPLTELNNNIRKFRSNLSLKHVDLSEPSRIWICPRPAIDSDKVPYNYLLNPGFNTTLPYRLGPFAWSEGLLEGTGTFSLLPGKGLYGYYGVRLSVSTDESISLKQNVPISFRRNQPYTATVWYAGMRPVRPDPIPSRSSGPYLLMTTVYTDGTTSSVSIFLEDDTGGEWKKAYVSDTPTRDTFSVEVSLVCRDYLGEPCVIDVGGLQLEQGSKSRPWCSWYGKLNPLYLVYPREEMTESTQWGTISYYRQTRLEIEPNLTYDQLLETPPNRCTKTEADGEVGVARETLDLYVEPDGMSFNIGWRIEDNLIERFNADTNMNEVFGTYEIADLYGSGDVDEVLYYKPSELGVTQTYEALTTSDKWLLVVVKEEYLGNTYRLLKICSPYIRWDDTSHLECVGEVYIDDGTGECTSIGLVDNRMDSLLITIDDVDYVLEMIWDSAARNEDNTIIMRSDISEAVMVS